MSVATAEVETLTAEVKTLVVGNRQVTLSVYRQLDTAEPIDVTPFGRVRDKQDHGTWVVGRDPCGHLVRARAPRVPPKCYFPVERDEIVLGKSEGHWSSPIFLDLGVLDVEGEVRSHGLVSFAGDSTEFEGWTWADGVDPAKYRAEAEQFRDGWERLRDHTAEWKALPLIVLAGLR